MAQKAMQLSKCLPNIAQLIKVCYRRDMATNLWDKFPDETDKAYKAFCVYRDMGMYRNLRKAVQELNKTKGYLRVLADWSKKYDWVERVEAYDHMLSEKRRKEYEKKMLFRVTDHNEVELKNAQRMQRYIDKLFDALEDAPYDTIIEESGSNDGQGNFETRKVTKKIHELAQSIHTKIEAHSKLGRRALRMPIEYPYEEPKGKNSGGQLEEIEKAIKETIEDEKKLDELLKQ